MAPPAVKFSVPIKPDGYADDGTPLFKKCLDNIYIIRGPYSPSPIERYRREAALLSRISHNHIVRIKGFHDSASEDEICLDLELAPYGSVLIFGSTGGERGTLFSNRLEQMIQIVDALDYLHNTCQVVHCSVHLSHLIVFQTEKDAEYPTGLVKLCGFGEASVVGETGQPGTPLDTRPPESMTDDDNFPEAYRSFATITVLPSYDIYSMGRVMLRWLFNINPDIKGMGLTGEEYQAALMKHMREVRDGSCLKKATENLPDWWKDLIGACCDIDPAKRISTAELKAKLTQEGRKEALPPNTPLRRFAPST